MDKVTRQCLQTTTFLKRNESRSGIEPRSFPYQLNALPLGQTGSQQRTAHLRQFQIFRHGPIVIYTKLPAEVIYYPICTSPTNSECLIGISDAFSAFVYGQPSSSPRAHCTPNKSVPTLRYTDDDAELHVLGCRLTY